MLVRAGRNMIQFPASRVCPLQSRQEHRPSDSANNDKSRQWERKYEGTAEPRLWSASQKIIDDAEVQMHLVAVHTFFESRDVEIVVNQLVLKEVSNQS